MKKLSPFKFKKFSICHNRSAMKVGVDGVLVGCWTDVSEAGTILDVGTGCGLIALIMAQRQPGALITAVDIDLPSAEEAAHNFAASPWNERLKLIHGSFSKDLYDNSDDCDNNLKFDLIISNPPYFNSGITQVNTPRERARHQGELSPASLLNDSISLLNVGGSVAIVIPADYSAVIEDIACSLGYTLTRKCLVRGHAGAPFKRVLLQWKLFNESVPEYICCEQMLTLEISSGNPTDDYRRLCKDFYLKF